MEIKDTPIADEFGLAGRYYYVNGKTVKLKGVNRHETNPVWDMPSPAKWWRKKSWWWNVPTSTMYVTHTILIRGGLVLLWTNTGTYLEDEANIESIWILLREAFVSSFEWKNAHVARVGWKWFMPTSNKSIHCHLVISKRSWPGKTS